ncbi:MAG: PD-(D/E)XK nuclease family protein [Leptospirales bacterium]|nr:PD-(D/E)XK nuclease family protein [Leptospirales bacterium]
MNDVKDILKLLKTYESLPKTKYEPTYLDICRYSGRRFEEICSKILAFYFQPKNEHGLKSLLIESLFESIDYNQDGYIDDNIEVETEVNAGGKRLDILIKNSDWVIGIENKIWANVYNPLEEYGKRIDQDKKQNTFKILLSLREISDKDELDYIYKNEFRIIYYTSFFESIKKNIGKYISDGNMKYIIFLYDLIQTLENMKGNNIMNKEMDAFFNENSGRLDELLEDYKKYKEKKDKKRSEKTNEICNKIVKETKNDKWKIWDKYDRSINNSGIGIYRKNDGIAISFKNDGIGIESWFYEENNDPIAFFEIKFTSWNNESWNRYGDQLEKLYPNVEKRLTDNRVFLDVYKINGYDDDEIIAKLLKCYECIINLK